MAERARSEDVGAWCWHGKEIVLELDGELVDETAQRASEAELVAESDELCEDGELVEVVWIDGMCGVY